ncbi:MAG TPA: hypothetical protein VH518_03760 [Tepidisphaeraceae bacterium]
MRLRSPEFTRLMYDLVTPISFAISVNVIPRSSSNFDTSRDKRVEIL